MSRKSFSTIGGAFRKKFKPIEMDQERATMLESQQ